MAAPPPPPSVTVKDSPRKATPKAGPSLFDRMKARNVDADDINPSENLPPGSLSPTNVWCVGYGRYGRNAQGDLADLTEFKRALCTKEKHVDDTDANAAETPVPTFECIALGAAHNVGVAKAGRAVYTWGKCHYGQLGLGQMTADRWLPWQIPNFPPPDRERVVSVSCGDSFVFAILGDGRCYSWGCGYFAALGHADENTETRPRLIDHPVVAQRRIIAAGCGSFHTILLTIDGEAIAFGKNEHGQTGVETNRNASGEYTSVKEPTVIKALEPYYVHDIDAGENHSVVVVSHRVHVAGSAPRRSLLTFGDNEHKQLGRDIGSETFTIRPGSVDGEVDISAEPSAVACGNHFTVAVSTEGKLWTWGWGDQRGRVVKAMKEDNSDPIEISFVQAGERHFAAVSKKGELFTGGGTALGHLKPSSDAMHQPTGEIATRRIVQVGCGSNSTIAREDCA